MKFAGFYTPNPSNDHSGNGGNSTHITSLGVDVMALPVRQIQPLYLL